MSYSDTFGVFFKEINSFLEFLSVNTSCITIKQDGVDCFYLSAHKDGCIHCLSKKALEMGMEERLKFVEKIVERIQAGDECLYEEKEYL